MRPCDTSGSLASGWYRPLVSRLRPELRRDRRSISGPAGCGPQPGKRRRVDRRPDGCRRTGTRCSWPVRVRQFSGLTTRTCHLTPLPISLLYRLSARRLLLLSCEVIRSDKSDGLRGAGEIETGEIDYGSAGIGTSTHLAGAYLCGKPESSLCLCHIRPVQRSLWICWVAALIQVSFVPIAFVLPLRQDGRLRALAVAAKAPIADSIAIPTTVSHDTAPWRLAKLR
jgi:hypothetical protein